MTYAKQDAAKHDDVPGPGNGYVDIYDTEGNLQLRLAHTLYLNAPWGVVQAPASFSGFGNDLLVGNFGSGLISAYNITTGAWIGNMLNVNDLPVQIDGLWGLTFGNGGSGGPAARCTSPRVLSGKATASSGQSRLTLVCNILRYQAGERRA